jgi:hypothetical protein
MGRDRFMHCTIHGLQQGKYREEKCTSVRQHDYILGLQAGEGGAKMNQSIENLYQFSELFTFLLFLIYMYIRVSILSVHIFKVIL